MPPDDAADAAIVPSPCSTNTPVGPKDANMKADETATRVEPSCVSGEFAQNYRFLTELIDCEEKNKAAKRVLKEIVHGRLPFTSGELNRRQGKIVKDYLRYLREKDSDQLFPPVPAELEASIKIRARSSWLPWEAEAVRKIDQWRGDVMALATDSDKRKLRKTTI